MLTVNLFRVYLLSRVDIVIRDNETCQYTEALHVFVKTGIKQAVNSTLHSNLSLLLTASERQNVICCFRIGTYIGGEKNLQPRPQDRVPLGVLFELLRAVKSFLYKSPPPGPEYSSTP